MKKLLRVLLVLFLILLVIVLLGPFLAGGFVKSKVESSLAENLDAKVSIKDLSLGWFSGLEMEGLRIDRKGERPLEVEIKKAEAEPNLMPLLGGNIVIDEARVHGVKVVTGVGEPEEDDEEDDDKKSDKSDGDLELPGLDIRLVVTDVTLAWQPAGDGPPARFDGISKITVEVKSGEDVTYAVDIDGGLNIAGRAEVFDGEKLRPRDDMKAFVTLKGSAVDLKHFEGVAAPWLSGLAGTLTVDERLDWAGQDTKIAAKGFVTVANVDAVGSSVPGRYELSSVEIRHGITGEDGTFAGDMTVKGGAGRLFDLPGFKEALDVRGLAMNAKFRDGKTLVVESMNVDVDGLAARGRAQASFEDDLAWSANVTLDGDVAKLAGRLGDLPDLAGKLDGTIDVARAADGRTVVKGRSRVRNFVARNLPGGVAPVQESEIVIRHDLETGGDKIRLEDVGVKASFLDVTATGAIEGEGETRTGQVDVRGNANLGTLLALVGDRAPVRMRGTVNIDAKTTARPDGYGIVANLTGNGVRAWDGPLGEDGYDFGRLVVGLDGRFDAETSAVDLSKVRVQSRVANFDGRVAAGAGEAPLRVEGIADFDVDQLARPFVDLADGPPMGRMRVDLGIEKIGEQVTLRKVEVTSPGITASANGAVTLRDEGAPVGEIRLPKLEADLARMRGILSRYSDGSGSGRVSGQGVVTLGDQHVVDLQLGGQQVVWNVADGGRYGAGRLTAKVKGRFGGATVIDDMNVTVQPASLRSKEGGEMQGDVTLDGRIDAAGAFRFDVVGRNLVSRPAAGGAPKRLQAPLEMEIAGQRDAEGTLYDVTTLKMKGDGLTANGRARWEKDRRFFVDTQANLDLKTFAATWLGFMYENARGQGQGRLSLRADLPLDGDRPMAHGTGELDLTAEEISVDGLTMKGLLTRANLQGGLAKITQGNATLNGGPATITGQADFRGDEPTFRIDLDAKRIAIVKELQPTIARVVPLFAGLDVTVQTAVDVALNVTGVGATFDAVKPNLTGVGSFAASNGRVSGSSLLTAFLPQLGIDPNLEFQAITSRFQVKNGRVIQDGLLIDGTAVDFKIAGSTGLDGSLDYSVGVKPEGGGAAVKFRQYAALFDAQGFLPVGLGGTIASPTPRPPDVGKIASGLVEGAIKDGLGSLLDGKDKKDGKKNDPLNPLRDLLGGGKKDKKKDGKDKKDDGKKKRLNPLDRLFGGKKDDKKNNKDGR